MQESRKNVVEFSRSRTAGESAGASLLNECGELAASRLGEALSKTLKDAANELLERTDQVMGYDMRRLYGEAREFAHDKRDQLESDFRKRFYQRYRREARRERDNPSVAKVDLEVAQLSLLTPDELEESLAASTVSNAINNTCGEELFGLSKRMGVLLDDPELQLGDYPLSPEIIGDVVMESLRAQDLPFKARLILVPLINKFLPGKIKLIYQDINRFLIDHKVLPTIRVGVSRRREPMPQAAAAHDESARQASAPQASGADLFALFQQLMGAGLGQGMAGVASPGVNPGFPPRAPGISPSLADIAGFQAPSAHAMPSPGAPIPGTVAPGAPTPGTSTLDSEVMRTLTRLQRGESTGVFLPGFDVGHVGNGQLNVLREIRAAGVTGGMGQMDAMTLDIVAMVFDYILDDRRIPDAMKALIGRLQIPVLKVALLDRSFFSQKSHPARQLLDVFAEASIGWDEEEGHASGLYQHIDELVQRILNQFDDKVDIFAAVLEDFRRFQADEKQRIDELTSQSAQAIHAREQGEIGRIVANDEVQGHLYDQPINDFIRAFLTCHWAPYLALLYTRDGEGGAAWKQAIQTMDDLIWSIKPMLNAQDRKRLVELLPNLLKNLEQGLAALGGTREMRDQFFTGLVKCHAEAVRAGLRDANDEAGPLPVTPPLPAMPIMPEMPASNDFEDIPVFSDKLRVDPALVRALADDAPPAMALEEITIGDVGWQPRIDADNAPDHFDTLVKQLRRGTWIELRQEDGNLAKVKLAWVSPLKGIYLFTNRLGQRAMSINGEGLAAKFREGRVQLIDNVPLMERAVHSLLERLQQSPTT